MRFSSLLSLALLVSPAAALGQSHFEVPVECGTQAEFRNELEKLLGKDAEHALPSLLRIEQHVEPGAGYTLYLQLGANGVREIDDPDCRTLLRSAAVIAAASSTAEPPAAATQPPAAATQLPPPTPTPIVTQAPAPVAVPRAALPRAPQAPPVREVPVAGARAPSHALFAGLALSSGVSPKLGAALELGADLEPAPWGLALALRYWFEQTAIAEGRGVDISALGARAAVLLRLAPFLNAAGGLEVNRLAGTALANVPGRDSDFAWQLAGTLGLNVIPWSIERLRVEIGVLGRASLVRPRFVVTGFGDVYRAPPLGGDAILRGVWLFP